MDSEIDGYIRQNRSRYTREAIRAQLIAAGHDPTAIDEAWERLGAPSGAATSPGWRPGWPVLLLLLVLGAVGAAVVWAGQPYGAGGIAPIVYFIVMGVAFAVAKGISALIDSGSSTIAIVLVGVGAFVGGVLGLTGGPSPSPFTLGLAVLAAGLVLVLLFLRSRSPRALGAVGAALPIIAWLVITGTCYAPLASRLQGQ